MLSSANLNAEARTPVARGDAGDTGFGIYIHWPFCAAKCPYCDFNSYVVDAVDQDAWRRALLAELDHFARLTPGRRVTSLFFGGGTPSLMPPETAAALIDAADRAWGFAAEPEITLEANPTSVEAGRFAAYRRAGVNRLSLGVQALNDADLRALGREHSAAEAIAAIDTAVRHFPRYSFDLIYVRPGQNRAGWAAELSRAVALAGDHLSLYQLTIEPNTDFANRVRRGALAVPDEDSAADLYEATQTILTGAGLPAYEVSNHARPGGESQHNLIYWRYRDYAGIGPGAHGRLTLDGRKWATRTHRAPGIWLDRTLRQGHAEQARAPLSPEAMAAEMLLMGLRLSEGVDLDRLRRVSGAPLDGWAAPARLSALVEAGYLVRESDRLRATAAGRQRLNAVLGYLLPGDTADGPDAAAAAVSGVQA